MIKLELPCIHRFILFAEVETKMKPISVGEIRDSCNIQYLLYCLWLVSEAPTLDDHVDSNARTKPQPPAPAPCIELKLVPARQHPLLFSLK